MFMSPSATGMLKKGSPVPNVPFSVRSIRKQEISFLLENGGEEKKTADSIPDTDVTLQEALARNSALELTIKKQQALIDELEQKNRKLSSALLDLSSTLDKCAAHCRSFQK